jgi:hypothetical protein
MAQNAVFRRARIISSPTFATACWRSFRRSQNSRAIQAAGLGWTCLIRVRQGRVRWKRAFKPIRCPCLLWQLTRTESVWLAGRAKRAGGTVQLTTLPQHPSAQPRRARSMLLATTLSTADLRRASAATRLGSPGNATTLMALGTQLEQQGTFVHTTCQYILEQEHPRQACVWSRALRAILLPIHRLPACCGQRRACQPLLVLPQDPVARSFEFRTGR